MVSGATSSQMISPLYEQLTEGICWMQLSECCTLFSMLQTDNIPNYVLLSMLLFAKMALHCQLSSASGQISSGMSFLINEVGVHI